MSRVILKSRLGYWKNGFEVGIAQCSSPEALPEYADVFCSYTRKNLNTRLNLMFIPEFNALILTTSGLVIRYARSEETNFKVHPQISGAEASVEAIPLRLLRAIVFHQRYYEQSKLTFAFIQKATAEEVFVRKLLVGYSMDLENKKQLTSCLAFDLRLNKMLFHIIYGKPYDGQKKSLIRYKVSSEGKAGIDLTIRKKNMLIGWNFEANLLPLAQKESYGLFKFGVRLESVHEKLFSDIP